MRELSRGGDQMWLHPGPGLRLLSVTLACTELSAFSAGVQEGRFACLS